MPENQSKKKHEKYYSSILRDLQACSCFKDIQAKCRRYESEIGEMRNSPTVSTRHDIDEEAMILVPSDAPNDPLLVPVSVTADGDCLPYTGSILGCGTETHPMEIRARIVIELAVNKETYLDPEYLQLETNFTDQEASQLPTAYAVFSDHYLVPTRYKA